MEARLQPPNREFSRVFPDWAPAACARVMALLFSLPSTAHATYSISALDTLTGELGGAGASCVPYAVDLIHGVVAGKAVLNAQASFDEPAKLFALDLLAAGASAAQTLSRVTDAASFPARDSMQWGIVDAGAGVAPFTGTNTLAYAGHLAGRSGDGRFAYSVQGNILTSHAVLAHMRDAFESAGCDLAERLLRALEAAALEGGGDSRCTPAGRSANSAYLDVTAPSGTRVHLSVPDVSPRDPTLELRSLYEAFRVDEPCPIPPEGARRSAEASLKDGCDLAAGQIGGGTTSALLLGGMFVGIFVRRLRRR